MLGSLSLVLFLLVVYPAHASLLATSLRFGMTSQDVVFLQKVLNFSADTQVALTGAGSPGHESTYFGAKTLSAVKRFQAKYSDEVLVPAGLSAPTGFVGAMTLKKLRTVANVQSPTPVAVAPSPMTPPVAPTSPTSPTPPVLPVSIPSPVLPATPVSSVATNSYPNLKNLDAYVVAVRDATLKNGTSPDVVALIEQKIRDKAATANYQQIYYDSQKAHIKNQTSSAPQSMLDAFLGKALTSVQGLFEVKNVQAAGPGVPFGGIITYVNPAICDCPPGIITQIFVALPNAPPPISNILLNYINGSEAFPYYNIPLPGIATLGFYTPAVPSCLTYVGTSCILIPAVGQITPVVGSSLVI